MPILSEHALTSETVAMGEPLMGRTNPTYRRWLARQEEDWQPFRRSLRAEHRQDFDRLFDRAVEHASAAGFQNAVDPQMALVFSVLVSQERELRELQTQRADA